MENLDNGLPPSNTDLTGKKIRNVNVDSKKFDDGKDDQGIHSISIQQKEASKAAEQSIESVNINIKEPEASACQIYAINYNAKKIEGNNTVLFYL